MSIDDIFEELKDLEWELHNIISVTTDEETKNKLTDELLVVQNTRAFLSEQISLMLLKE